VLLLLILYVFTGLQMSKTTHQVLCEKNVTGIFRRETETNKKRQTINKATLAQRSFYGKKIHFWEIGWKDLLRCFRLRNYISIELKFY
jgi:hypothetical protein